MKSFFTVIAVLGIVFVASAEAMAAGGCPQSAEHLQAFANCLAPVRGTVAMVYKGTLANLDPDNAAFLNTMQRTAVVPPQVIPSYPTYSPYAYNPFGPAMMRATAYVAATKSGNPAYWWMSAGMPMY
jgi:hypothetical protein